MAIYKTISFLIYYVAVYCFLFYVDVSHIYSSYKDWLFFNAQNNSIYDFVIVGAGSAGSVLATRLLNSGAKVLLIEAGGNPGFFFNVPVIAPLLLNTKYDWQYKTVPQNHACRALKNNASFWPAGKILGGSSRLNNMVHLQGHHDDYKDWFPDYQEHLHTARDVMHFDNQTWHSQMTQAFMAGISELSYFVRNINEKSWTGFMKAQTTTKNGERWSTDRVILEHSNERLTLAVHSLVQKILFKLNKAVGVEYIKGKTMYKAFARKAVILSAGAIGSPKLLMLSGIGPKKQLQKLKIKTIVDLPVGQHLMDHIITGLDLVTINCSEAALSIRDVINPHSALDYLMLGRGPWTTGGVDATGTFHSSSQNSESAAPDLQIMTFPLGVSQDNGILLRKNLGISDKVFDKYFSRLVYKTTITIASVLLHPKSYGSVKLASSNPLDDPIIDPNYLSNDEDVHKLIEGIEFIKKLINTTSMRKLGAELYQEPFPGCEHLEFDTVTYWECYIRHLTLSTYHPAGTCGVGRIVDTDFRVYGTENLFVVDASVFQQMPSGNTNTPVIALAEKAAKLLIQGTMDMESNSLYCDINEIFLLHKSIKY